MKALRWHAARDVRVDDVEEPGLPSPGFTVVDVAYCGICGSDLAEYRSGPNLMSPRPHPLTGQAPPLTLGHELSGRVSAVADGSRLEAGTRVTVDACWRCNRCDACRSGDYHLCRYGGSVGFHSDGGFAARVSVPEYTLIPLPEGVGDEAAALTEPLAVGLHALGRGHVDAGDDVLVLGFGPIGAAAALCARAVGATPLIVERVPVRLGKAAEMGFATLEAGDELPRRVRRAFGSGGADAVIESTGVAALLPDAVECAKRGGRIVLVGISGRPSRIESRRLALFERSLVGSLGYRHDLPRVVKMMQAGQLDPLPLIGDVVELSDAPAMFSTLASRPDERIKVLVSVADREQRA